MPFFVGAEKGFFDQHGLDVKVTVTGSSTELREGLAAGKYQVAHTAADNAVAMVELQHTQTVIVMGGDNSFNHLFVTPEIKTYEDLRGKTLVVDAPNTAFALVAYQMLADHGLKRGDYNISLQGGTPVKRLAAMAETRIAQAGMLNLPYSILAPAKGLHDLGSLTSAIGPYQGTTGFQKTRQSQTAAGADERSSWQAASSESAGSRADMDGHIARPVAKRERPRQLEDARRPPLRHKQWRQVADQARPRVPKLAKLMDNAEADVLAYRGFAAQHRAKIHSTNPIERLNGEIKRRSDVIGIFRMMPRSPG